MCMPIENYPYTNFYARLRPVPSFGYSGAPSEAGERFDLRSCCYSFPAPRPCIFPWNLAPCALCLVPLFLFPRSSVLEPRIFYLDPALFPWLELHSSIMMHMVHMVAFWRERKWEPRSNWPMTTEVRCTPSPPGEVSGGIRNWFKKRSICISRKWWPRRATLGSY